MDNPQLELAFGAPAKIKRLVELLDVGAGNAATAAELAEGLGLSSSGTCPELRDLIRRAIVVWKIPIGSSSQGYYIPASSTEMFENVRSLYRRSERISERADALREAYWHHSSTLYS